MKTINISVRDKLPLVTSMSGRAVADNRYRLQFEFDDEWAEGLKTVIVALSAKQYRMYPTTADYVDIELGGERYITVGVIQDTIATSQPCQILVNESIRKHMGEKIELPEPDVWMYITEQIRTLNTLRLYPVEKTKAMTQQVGRDADGKLWTYPGGSGGSGGGGIAYEIGYGLELSADLILSAEVGKNSFKEIPNTKVQEIFNKVMTEG